MATATALNIGIVEPVERTSKIVRKNQNTKEVIFREEVARIMREDGASEEFIEKWLTDNAVKEAISNHFTAESLAWALLQ